MDNIKFGKLILKLRKEKNMTQKELAEKLNVTDKAVSKWERGDSFPDITLLEPIAKVLGVTLKDGQITEIGIEMEKMPVSARIARMLIEAKKYSPQVQGDMAIIGAILECGDFRGKKFYVPAMLTDECKKSDLTYQLLLVKTINNLWRTLEGSERVEFYVDRGIKKKISKAFSNPLKILQINCICSICLTPKQMILIM